MMEDLNGASAAEILKMQGNTTPVIAITAVSSGDMDLVKDKFIKVFHKPVIVSELFNYVESII
jgi:DNA-binding response OmpR family regulator